MCPDFKHRSVHVRVRGGICKLVLHRAIERGTISAEETVSAIDKNERTGIRQHLLRHPRQVFIRLLI